MHYRLRGFFKFLMRLVFVGLGLGTVFLGWRAFLHYGPGRQGDRPLFLFHAKALIRQRLAFPRPVATVFLPAPPSMSSADVQLRLMKWWDGKHWLPEALAHGEASKAGLLLHAGALTLVDVTEVSLIDTKAGVPSCKVRARVRWDFPEDLQELLRVKEIVALRLVKGLTPGQAAEMTCTFTRKGWSWELLTADTAWGGKLPLTKPSPSPLDWLF